MKKILLPALLILGGCQSTTTSPTKVNESNQDIKSIASTNDINQALLTDESIDVIHPVEDVEFSLKDNTLKSPDDVPSNESTFRFLFHILINIQLFESFYDFFLLIQSDSRVCGEFRF